MNNPRWRLENNVTSSSPPSVMEEQQQQQQQQESMRKTSMYATRQSMGRRMTIASDPTMERPE